MDPNITAELPAVPEPASEQDAITKPTVATAAKAERDAKRGSHLATVDELVAKGRSVVDRVVDKVRHVIKK